MQGLGPPVRRGNRVKRVQASAVQGRATSWKEGHRVGKNPGLKVLGFGQSRDG